MITGNLEMDEVSLIQDGEVAGLLQVYAFPMVDDTGNFVGVVEYIRDITEQKRAEEKLRESEEKYRSLMEQSPDMLYLHDLDGNLLEVNQAVVLNTGYAREELLQMSAFDIHSGPPAPDELMRQWEKWPAGYSMVLESINRRKDGRAYRARGSPYKAVAGTGSGACGVRREGAEADSRVAL